MAWSCSHPLQLLSPLRCCVHLGCGSATSQKHLVQAIFSVLYYLHFVALLVGCVREIHVLAISSY